MRALAQKQNQPVRRASPILARPGLHLQRTVDPQAVQTTRFAHDFTRIPVHARVPVGIQPKLAINAPGDASEREADRAAEQAMGVLPKQSSAHVKSNDFEQTAAPPIVHEVLRSPGQPLDSATRALMEPRFGHDFTQVRLHTNARAAESAAAVNAIAYTVGNDIVFGAGQHAPASSRGQQLIAHELAHVVQQSGGPASLARQVPKSDQEAQKNEDAKKEAVKRHKEQQQHVVEFVARARAIQPNPKKGLRDPDNLVRNAVGMLDSGKLTLTILSPTHYSPVVNFDARVRHPAIGADYPARPWVFDAGIVSEQNTSSAGRIAPLPAPITPVQTGTVTKDEPTQGRVSPSTGRVEPAPAKTDLAPAKVPATPPAPIPFSPRDVWMFTRGLEITEAGFKNTFVHEVQHVADLSLLKPNADQDRLEGYKSEFRAYWIQPPIPRTGALGVEAIQSLPEATDKLASGGKVSVSKPAKCTICPAPDPAAKGAYEKPEGVMKNPRQKAIFEYIMSHYLDQEYACCYIYNRQFHEGVDQFAYPESVNLIDSDRLMDLNLAVRNLDRSKPLSPDSRAELVTLLTRLEPLDWIFLNDRKLSKPFWDMLKSAAPASLNKAVNALVGKGMKNPVTQADVDKVLPGK